LRAICNDLNDRGVLTAKDRTRQLRGKPVQGTQFAPSRLAESLQSPTMLGYVVTKGEVLRTPDGDPVVRSEPIMDRETFERVKSALAARGVTITRHPNVALLVGVFYCGVCGEKMYSFRLSGQRHGKPRPPYYRCASAQKRSQCSNGVIQAELVESLVEGTILRLLGDTERMRKVWVKGEDHSAELAEINAQLEDLTDLLLNPVYRRGTPQRARLEANIKALSQRQAALSAPPVRASGYHWETTGERLKDWWTSASTEQRNAWLQEHGVRLTGRKRPGRGVSPSLELDLGDLDEYLKTLHAPEDSRAAGLRDALADVPKGTGIEV